MTPVEFQAAKEELELRGQRDWQICEVCEGSGDVGAVYSGSCPICPECDGLGMVHLGQGH